MIKRYFTVGLLVALGGCSDATDPTPEPVTTAAVRVIDNRFDPGANRVDPNKTVTWTWNGNNQHNVTFDDSSIGNSATLAYGTFSKSFGTDGEYTYYCTIHGRTVMSGAVVVGASNVSGSGY